MELYNEELTDLLSIDNDKEKRLRLLEDRSGVVVQGLEEVVVKSAAGAAPADIEMTGTEQGRL
jgi:kinesin family protein 11